MAVKYLIILSRVRGEVQCILMKCRSSHLTTSFNLYHDRKFVFLFFLCISEYRIHKLIMKFIKLLLNRRKYGRKVEDNTCWSVNGFRKIWQSHKWNNYSKLQSLNNKIKPQFRASLLIHCLITKTSRSPWWFHCC